MTDAIDDYGTLERSEWQVALRFRRRLAAPPERVWRALTEDGELERWFPTTIEGAARPARRCASPIATRSGRPSTARCSRSSRRG